VTVDRCRVSDCGYAGIDLSVYASSTEGASNEARAIGNTVEGAPYGIMAAGNGMLIDRNRVAATSGGIQISASTDISGSTVRRNVIQAEGPGAPGIVAWDRDSVFEKNRVTGGNYGLEISGDRQAILGNVVEGAGWGIATWSSEGRTERNRISAIQAGGILFGGTGATGLGNSVAGGNGTGIVVQSSGGTFAKNRVTACSDGFFVTGGGNTFERNTATGNTGLSIGDANPEGLNTYLKNRLDKPIEYNAE
jgi:parallel beta-helix repeat protein